MSEGTADPAALVMHVATGYWLSRALHEVAATGVADRIDATPVSATDLAAATGLHADALQRTLRALAMSGIFVETTPGCFAHSEASVLLRDDNPRTMRPVARFMGDEAHWRSYGAFGESLRTGLPSCQRALGASIFDYYAAHPDQGEQFNRGMTAHSLAQIAAVVDAYDFTDFRRIADVGGGRGHVLAKLLACAPAAEGVLFDLPYAIEQARKDGLLPPGRVTLMAGNFFETAPEGCDLYVLKHILHDWNDADCRRILGAIHHAMPAGARLLVLEMLRPDGPEPHFAKVLDLEMLVLAGGRERSEAEFRTLFADSDFKLARVVPTSMPIAILEVVRA